jgi:excisionase family DNA binding protein
LSASEDDFLLPGEAAQLLHVTPKTLARWASRNRIPSVLTVGGHHRFRRKDVEALARQMHRGSSASPGP